MLPRLLASYYKARYRLNRLMRIFKVKPTDLVLDIGSGDSPFAPADVLCEKFPWDDFERTARFKQDRPLVVGDIEALPFKDKAFDFIHCSHVLEHTFHPEKAIQELTRVGRRGYIEVPTSYFEKSLRSFPGHLWFVSWENGTLVFRAKSRGVVDQELIDTLESRLMDRDPLFSAYYYGRFSDLFTVQLWWEGKIPCRVEGTPPAGGFVKGTAEMGHGETKAEQATGVAKVLKSWVKRRSERAKRFQLQDLLGCPVCKGPLAWKNSVPACGACRRDYRVVEGIPVLLV